MTINIIGITDHPTPWFPPDILEIISKGKVFSGGIRHHEIVKPLLPQGNTWINITIPLDNVFTQYQSFEEIVVFASGDPLFFGFANTVKRKMPQAEIIIYPTFNSLQLLAHRLLMRYDDMRMVSLTGRPWHEFDQALIKQETKIGVLTDREHTPATIAQRMLEYGYTNYTMHVGEHLGNPEMEMVRTLSIEDAAKEKFSHPNNLILEQKACRDLERKACKDSEQKASRDSKGSECRQRFFGIPDHEFTPLNGRSKMITKAPIRLLTLSALKLPEKTSFWDIGFCTGSISIEAKLQFPHLHITSFEIRPEGAELMEANSRKFGTPGITAVIGDFTEADLSLHPAPDAVFIGGHGGKLEEIIGRIKEVLQPEGIIVFNSVSEESKTFFITGIKEADMELLPTTRVAIDDHNPIEIMKAKLKR